MDNRINNILDKIEFNTKIIVIKYGGNAMLDDNLKSSVAKDIVQLKKIGLYPVVVHGGGPAVSKQMDKENIKPEFVHGQRKTDEETLEIAEMVLSGKVNKDLVRLINENNGKAVGISGKDGKLVKSKKWKKEMNVNGEEKKVDLGKVGEVYSIDNTLLETLLDEEFIPVISPICAGKDGGDFNVNADILAGEIASSLKADSLIYLTNVDGIHEKNDDPGSRIGRLYVDKAESLIGDVIKGGMIPKVESAIKAIREGVKTAKVIDGTRRHSLIQSFEESYNSGTVLYSDGGN
ncbi:MAG: acetylglutamate kinase [Candidatus Thermoplasmatota archaeon]